MISNGWADRTSHSEATEGRQTSTDRFGRSMKKETYLLPDVIEQFIVDDNGRVGVITDYATKNQPNVIPGSQTMGTIVGLKDPIDLVILIDGHLEAHVVDFSQLMLLIKRASWPTEEDMKLLS